MAHVAIVSKGISDELWPSHAGCVGKMKQHFLQRVHEWCLLRKHAGAASRKTQTDGEKLSKYLKEQPYGATGLGGLGLAACFMNTWYDL